MLLRELLAAVLGAEELSVTHRPFIEIMPVESENTITFGRDYFFLLSLVVV